MLFQKYLSFLKISLLDKRNINLRLHISSIAICELGYFVTFLLLGDVFIEYSGETLNVG